MAFEEFRQSINKHFNLEEIKTLCFDLNIDYEDLGGDGKQAKVREVVYYCQRNDRLPELIVWLKKNRPRIAWQSLIPEGNIANIQAPALKLQKAHPLEAICRFLNHRYAEISEHFTPMEVRKELRLCPWEPKFIFRNPTGRSDYQKEEKITYDLIETLCSAQRLVILGEPGTGKSTGLHVAAHRLTKLWLANEKERVPLIINLNRYTDFSARYPRELLMEMILHECNRALPTEIKKLELPEVTNYLQSGLFAVFFDGLNEVPANLRTKCIQSLIDFCDEFEACDVVVTSRRYMYNGELPFPAMEVLELGRDEIIGFVEKYADSAVAQSIMDSVTKTKWHLFQNPLALHMMVRVFQETGDIPSNRALLIENYVHIVLERYIANTMRTGGKRVNKDDLIEFLISVSKLMSEQGLCLPLQQVTQHLRGLFDSTEYIDSFTDIAVESGLLVREGGSIRFWHHNIQEFFFVLAIYSDWKQETSHDQTSRKYISRILKRPEKWETISMVTGLMSRKEAALFLEECAKKDEYLTAMSLNHCSENDLIDKFQGILIRKSKKISGLSYWIGNILEWDFTIQVIVIMIIAKQVLRITGIAFQEPPSVLTLPFLDSPYLTEDVLQLVTVTFTFILLRRISDYIVFVRFNTLIRALQHIGTPESRSELMRIFQKFSDTARIDLNHLTVIRRVTVSNICSRNELIEGLKLDHEKLYSIVALSNIAGPSDLPLIYEIISADRDRTIQEAALDCITSIADRYPTCKNDPQYQNILLYLTNNSILSIQARRKAYAHYVEASGSAEGIAYPSLSEVHKLQRLLVSPTLISYYSLIIFVALIMFQPQILTQLISSLASFSSSMSPESYSMGSLLRIIILNLYFMLVLYFAVRIDTFFQKLFRKSSNRKWLLLGEATLVDVQEMEKKKLDTRAGEIRDFRNDAVWQGPTMRSVMERMISFGLRAGYEVDYIDEGKLSLKLMLRSEQSKSQTSRLYKFLSWSRYLIYFVFVFFLTTGAYENSSRIAIGYLGLELFRLFMWPFISPTLSIILSHDNNQTRIESNVRLGSKRLPSSRVDEAKTILARAIAEVAQ